MIKLTDILQEIKIAKHVPNNLKQLEQIKVQMSQDKDKETKVALAIKAAELVLPIWEYYYPNDERPRKAIEAAKSGNADAAYAAANVAEDAIADNTDNAAAYVAYAAWNLAYAAYSLVYAASNAAYAAYATSAVDNAIKSTKLHFKLK
jgi:hypothetical protein